MDFKTVSIYKSVLIMLFVSSDCIAAKANADLYSDTQYTNNARLSSSATQDDLIQKVGLNFSILEERKKFNADAKFNLSQDFYLNKSYSDQTQLTTGFGLFNFDIVEEFLDWKTSFTRSQVLNSSLAVDTPDNREEKNTFRTGPSINYRINTATNLTMFANYVQVENSSKSAADTKRGDLRASYHYTLNSVTNFSLGGSYDQVFSSSSEDQVRDNDNEVVKKGINAGFNRVLPKGVMGLTLGRESVEEGKDEISSYSTDFYIQKKELLSHDFSFTASRNVSDSSIGFSRIDSLGAIDGIELDDGAEDLSVISGQGGLDLVTQTSFNLNLERSFDLYQYQFEASWNDIDYKTQIKDERVVDFMIQVRNRPEKTLNLGFKAKTKIVKPLDQGDVGNALTQTFTIDGRYQWIKELGFNAYIEYTRRGHSRNHRLEYEEFSTGIGVKWNLL